MTALIVQSYADEVQILIALPDGRKVLVSPSGRSARFVTGSSLAELMLHPVGAANINQPSLDAAVELALASEKFGLHFHNFWQAVEPRSGSSPQV